MRTTLLAMAAWCLGGCMGTTRIQQRLHQVSGELTYLRDTSATEPKAGTLSIDSFVVAHELPATTTVRRTFAMVVPLLVVNVWWANYQARLGTEQLTNDYVAFMKDSLAWDVRRGARCALVEKDGDLRIDVRVNRIEMKAPFVESGSFLFLPVGTICGTIRHKEMLAGPVDVAVEGELVVRRGGAELLRKKIVGSSRVGSRREGSFDEYVAAFGRSMIRGLSFAVAAFNESVIEEVNRL